MLCSRNTVHFGAAFIIGLLSSHAVTAVEDARRPWDAPALESAIAIREGRTNAVLPFDELLERLATADAVFLGESHTDEATHRVELAVYEGLLERRGGQVVLTLEMFERDVQPLLDSYLAGEIDEAAFLEEARPWTNYATSYRPLIEHAKSVAGAVVAANFPKPLIRRLAMEGPELLEQLNDAERKQVPAEFFANTAEYWRRVDNAVRGHRGMMNSGGDDERLYDAQSLWDNSMGAACAAALDDHPGYMVLHVNGGFHTAYWDGTARQFKLRKPDAKMLTVAIVPTANPHMASVGSVPIADYVVFAEARATDKSEGQWGVYVPREQKYRLHVPESASREHPAPLLIWLVDDGLTASDGLDLWRDRLGDEAAIAVIEPPYPAVQPDLSVGGRWFWPETFFADIDTAITTAERSWAYILRHFPVDPERVCVAGEGTGATVATALGLLTGRISGSYLGLEPTRYIKLKDFPLPLPEYRDKDAVNDNIIRVTFGDGTDEWWRGELAEYANVGLNTELKATPSEPWDAARLRENMLRELLELPMHPSAESSQRWHVVVATDSPRGRHWSRLVAQRVAREKDAGVAVYDAPPEGVDSTLIETTLHADAYAAEGALPKCPGPFGGTTIVVVPDSALPAELRGWNALAENDPLAQGSRFFRLRIATPTGEQALPSVLETLHGEGRNNVLIVPAMFCADAALMQALARTARSFEDQMTLQWSPGLGGRPVSFIAPPPAKAQLPVQHRLSIVLDPDTHALKVEDRIELPRSLAQAGAEFTLDANLAIRESTPSVTRVVADEDGVATYKLNADPSNGVFEIKYLGVIDHGLSDQKEEYTRGFRESRGVLGPEGVYLHGESAWVPRFNDGLIRFEVGLQAPADWHVISQGNGTSRGDDGRAHWESGGLVEQVYLVGGPLVRQQDMAGAVETLVYLHEADPALGRKYLDATARYLEMYRRLIGPYPYGKFALVENFWETGYGMPSFTLLGPQIIRFPFIITSSYPHEILHNWWGNSVFVDYASGNWCEGLTAYLADHLLQEQRGAGAEYRRTALQKYRNYVNEGRDFPLVEFHSRHDAATEAVGYGKALMVFHMLRRQIGDDAFREALAKFYRDNRGRRASFADVRAAFAETTGDDLAGYFEQWVDWTGAPALALRDVAARAEGDHYVLTGALEQTQPGEAYGLRLPVQVLTAAGIEEFEVTTRAEPNHRAPTTHGDPAMGDRGPSSGRPERAAANGKRTDLRFEISDSPLAVALDPQFDVFRLLDPRETPPSIGQLFGEPRILAVLPEHDAAAIPYRDLLEGWRSEEHEIEIVNEADISTLPVDRNVWIVGRENRFVADVLDAVADAALSADGAALSLAGEQTPLAEHCVVVVARHPENMERALGWIAVDPAAAVVGLGRKLPHYGKYSYLAFEGDAPTNTIKGQWSAEGSPLVVSLAPGGAAQLAAKLPPREPLAELPPVFSQRSLMEHVEWLASPERAGRGLGTPELAASAEYIAKAMESAGLQPAGDHGAWFQHFTVEHGPDGTPVDTVNVIGRAAGHEGRLGHSVGDPQRAL